MKATMASILYFDNRRTMAVHFLLMPLANLLLLSALGSQLTQRSAWSIAAASVLASGCLMLVSSMAASFACDRNYGIDREVLSLRKFCFYYWGCKVTVCTGAALALISVNLVLLAAAGCPWALIWKSILSTPQVLFSGIAVGFFCAIGAWGSSDPYRLSNFFISFGNVLSGSVVALSAYPPLLKPFAAVFPLAHTLSALHGTPAQPAWDMLCAVIWLLIGAILYVVQARSIASQSKFSTL